MKNIIKKLKEIIEEVQEPKAHIWFRLTLIMEHLGEVCRDSLHE